MMGDGSTLCLVMSDPIQDTKESTKNGLNNNPEYTPTLNTPCVDDTNTLHEPRTNSSSHSSRRKSETQGRGRRLESINEDSECFTSVIRSTSTSTVSFSPPFSGFQVPETTIVTNVHERKSRSNVNLSAREAIPVMPPAIAIICLIFNIIIPGTGYVIAAILVVFNKRFLIKVLLSTTNMAAICLCLLILLGMVAIEQYSTIISGFVAFCLSQEEAIYDKMAVLCVNCFVGIAQMATVVFLMIGWIWSITWGCAFVGLSLTKYGRKRIQGSGQLEVSTS